MKNLYVVSIEPYCGKTALCVGMAINLRAQGLKVNYMKPVGNPSASIVGITTDEDAVNVCRALGCESDLALSVPVLLTPEVVRLPLRGPVPDLSTPIKPALAQLSQDQDLMILEGAATIVEGLSLGLSAIQVAEMTDARVLLVTKAHRNLSLDDILAAEGLLHGRLIGVVVNFASKGTINQIRADLTGFLAAHNLQLFGVVPSDRHLMAITVREIQEALGADLLSGTEDEMEELVEDFMIGAMTADAALHFFQRKADKAVITGGDRSDIQLAALRTPTKCLILTGNLRPIPAILGRAAEAKVPVLLAREDTLTVTERLGTVMGRARLTSPQQVRTVVQMVKRDIDLDALKNALS